MDKSLYPVHWYQHQDPKYKESYSLLSLVTNNPNNQNRPNFYVAELKKGANNTDIGKDNMEAVEAIGQSLHSCLIPSTKSDTFSASQRAYGSEASILDLQRQDDSPLRVLLHGISTGDRFYQEGSADQAASSEGVRGDILNQRQYNATFAASDLLRTAKGGCRRGSKFKDFMSDQLNIAGVGDHVRDLVGCFGLCRSRTYLPMAENRAVNEKIRSGWDPAGRGYGLVVGAYDNVGMKKRAGYVQ